MAKLYSVYNIHWFKKIYFLDISEQCYICSWVLSSSKYITVFPWAILGMELKEMQDFYFILSPKLSSRKEKLNRMVIPWNSLSSSRKKFLPILNEEMRPCAYSKKVLDGKIDT